MKGNLYEVVMVFLVSSLLKGNLYEVVVVFLSFLIYSPFGTFWFFVIF